MKITNSLKCLLLASAAFSFPAAAWAQDGDDGDTIIVRGSFIPEPQEATSQVATFLSEADLERTGDDTIALALTRLSGLSVVNGKFAFVRGLGDRYSSALLNGSPLPSPEPLRRTVPLDLFPSNALRGAAVQKTYSANYPGEFGGGVIDIETLRTPAETFFNVKTGIGYNTETTMKDGIFVRGSSSDWTGYDDGLRDLPSGLSSLISSQTSLNGLPSDEVEAIGESLVNSPLSVIQDGQLGPDYEVGVELGTILDKGGLEIGLIGVGGYDQSWTTERAQRQLVQGGIVGSEFENLETTLDVTWNGLGSASFIWDTENFRNEVAATGFYVHSTSKEAQVTEGRDFNAQGTGEIFTESSSWIERELAMGQLVGDHFVGDWEINWRGAYARSTRDAPYERSLFRFKDENGVPLYSIANSNSLRFSELQDDVVSGGIDVAYTADLFGGRSVFSAGYDYAKSEREYDFLALRFVGGNSLPADVQAARPDFLFSPDNIDPARFVLQELVSPNDSYAADLTVNAAYVQGDLELTPYIRSTLGVRYEQGEQNVATFDRFGNPGAAPVVLDNEYYLPTATFTWNFANDLQLRLGYSETIARPQFRELARSSYFDPESDRIYRGNNGLVDSELTNYDARLEYYMGRNQFITLAGFYKEIENPIEELQFSTSTFVFETTFINSPKATLYGGEAEYRTNFQMPGNNPFLTSREWLFSTNYTYTFSEVEAGDGEQVFDPISGQLQDASLFGVDGARLQGAPEHIANVQFGWEGDTDQLTLLLGYVSERILQRGVQLPGAELPDVLEEPGVQLDLVFRQDLVLGGRDFTLGISGRNLLDVEHREFQENAGALGETEFNTYDRGRSFSLSLEAKF